MTRFTTFAINTSSWMMWLVAGFSAGGAAVFLERAITLIGASDTFRRFKTALLARALPLLGDHS
jgi:hypothetical protein